MPGGIHNTLIAQTASPSISRGHLSYHRTRDLTRDLTRGFRLDSFCGGQRGQFRGRVAFGIPPGARPVGNRRQKNRGDLVRGADALSDSCRADASGAVLHRAGRHRYVRLHRQPGKHAFDARRRVPRVRGSFGLRTGQHGFRLWRHAVHVDYWLGSGPLFVHARFHWLRHHAAGLRADPVDHGRSVALRHQWRTGSRKFLRVYVEVRDMKRSGHAGFAARPKKTAAPLHGLSSKLPLALAQRLPAEAGNSGPGRRRVASSSIQAERRGVTPTLRVQNRRHGHLQRPSDPGIHVDRRVVELVAGMAELPLDPTAWTRVDTLPPSGLDSQKNRHDYSAQIPGTLFPTAPYLPSRHLFDVHSWGFTGGSPNLGFGLMSDDKMHLADVNAALLYNTDEGTFGYQTGFSYNRFFPVLDFGFADRGRRLQYVDHTDDFPEHRSEEHT